MRMKVSVGWRCSACGELITRIEDGWVEWLAGEDVGGVTALKGLRLVHRLGTGPGTKFKSYACQYDSLREFRTDRSIVEGLSLERFMGPDGLMLAVITNRMPRNARGRHNGTGQASADSGI